jgi:hypothetical protein
MARTTGVQVDRLLLIGKLKDKVKDLPKALKEYDDAKKAYDKEVLEWLKALVSTSSAIKEVTANSHYRNEDYASVYFTDKALKTKPKYTGPDQPRISGYAVERALEEIKNTINILELSTSDTVGVSILNKVSMYL